MPKKCPQCGATLPAGALDGLCPACLLAQGAEADTAVQPEAPKFQPPGVEEVAKLFPQLEILAFIGKGGMGAVYKARQPGLDRLVALKILPPQVASPGFAERFNREARALARLSHPNIVAVHEFGQVNGQPFFLMEFVDGPNLREIERAGRLSAREALEIVPQICAALQFAHDEGIVHRDIKPENILLDKKGRVKIADFGIAKIIGRAGETKEPELTETKGAIGTPHYMAPEQVEKPQEVDHRADIFALGVVFYEMLTGELPLGKFAPPSRMVQVDVRLDDVVLRALEKEPERRYQHVSQVKTALDTIASTAPPPLQSPPNAGAFAQEVLARDYTLNIGACLRRGWALVQNDFWPLVGVSGLMMLLLGVANSAGAVVSDKGASVGGLVGLLVNGALIGGWNWYFLKKIRGETVSIEDAFAGFSKRFLHLFLGSLVMFVLMMLGFLCFILPGIYLWVAWSFTLPLIMDRRLDFWSAMELSRKVVSKHWWKLFCFVLVLTVFAYGGLFLLCVGIFITAPIASAALLYAYEDIFGAAGRAADARSAGVGPQGTAVSPGAPAKSPHTGGAWKPAVVIGVGLAALVIVGLVIVTNLLRSHHRTVHMAQVQRNTIRANEQARQNQAARKPAFGPVIEQVIQARATGTNQFLDLDKGALLTLPEEIASALRDSQPFNEERAWQALDIPADSRRSQYLSWLRESGADLMFAGNGKLIGFDCVFPLAHGDSSTNWENWDGLRPERVNEAVNVVDWSRRATEAARNHKPVPPAPKSGGVVNSAAQIDSQFAGGPTVNLLTRDQSVLWFFKTRGGAKGVLQIAGFTDDPSAVKVRYKLVEKNAGLSDTAPDTATSTEERENLSARLEAATMMTNVNDKDRMLAKLAEDAARAGEARILERTLGQIVSIEERDGASIAAVRALAKRGMKSEALGVAKGIPSLETRDQALAELADGAREPKKSD